MTAGRTITGRLLALERDRNTRSGNPTWVVVFDVRGGDVILGRSAPDSTLSELSPSLVGKSCIATYRATLRGVEFDSIELDPRGAA